MYHLEELDGPCTNDKLIIFSRAHYSYINQIFGDLYVREIIQQIYKNKKGLKGTLISEESTAGPFIGTWHHMFKLNRKEICSVNEEYQNVTVDVNDTLCQSYSLMNFMQIPFDKTPSITATIKQKKEKQMAMIGMYRQLLSDPKFIKTVSDEIMHPANDKLWSDSVDDDHPFYILERYKNISDIIQNIQQVLDVWEKYGWQYFIKKGKCISQTTGGMKSKKSLKSKLSTKSRKYARSKKTKVY